MEFEFGVVFVAYGKGFEGGNLGGEVVALRFVNFVDAVVACWFEVAVGIVAVVGTAVAIREAYYFACLTVALGFQK